MNSLLFIIILLMMVILHTIVLPMVFCAFR